MQACSNLTVTLFFAFAGCAAYAACATPPRMPQEGPGPSVASTQATPKPAAGTTPNPAPAAPAAADSGASEGCAEESETVPVVIATQHARGKKVGFVVKMQSPVLKVNETLIDTSSLKGGYNCCVLTEVESIRFECELADGNSLGRVYREKDDLVIDPGEGHEVKRLPIPCGAWLRFRGPVKECESSPP
jgi:hypothetical protein